MSSGFVHILHLTPGSLRWATLEGARRNFSLRGTGVIEGSAIQCLDQWMINERERGGEIYLYDGRPMFFSFKTALPARAKKQIDSVVKLKIRQELGLAEDAVDWSVQAKSSRESPGQLDLFTVVVRKEALDDIRDWKRRHDLRSLWVGADIAAVHTLVSRGLLPAPVLVVNEDPSGATLYHAAGEGQIAKGRVEQHEQGNGAQLPEMSWGDSTPRASFGGGDRESRIAGHPVLRSLPAAPAVDFNSNGRALRSVGGIGAELSRFDAIVLGGLVDVAERRTPMRSLIADEATAPRAELDVVRKVKLQWLVPACIVTVIMLAVSLWGLRGNREQARLDLVRRANSLSTEMGRLTSQEGVLRQIKSQRAELMPVIGAIYGAAPPGVTFQSLSMTEGGSLEINASTKDQAEPNAFLTALSESDVLQAIRMPAVKPVVAQGQGGDKKPTYEFKITGQIKDRMKKKRR